MEFILHLPQDIDKNGALWQVWNSLCQNLKFFQNTELQATPYMNASSLLLFAAHDQINFICSSLKMYNIDLPQLNQILQVVEQACLPYFILLFERFKYFSLKPNSSDSLDEFTIILRKQIEFCEFGNLKDSMLTNALDSSIKRESLVQHLSNSDGLHFDDISVSLAEPQIAQAIEAIVVDTNTDAISTKPTTQSKRGRPRTSHKESVEKVKKKSNNVKSKKKNKKNKRSKKEDVTFKNEEASDFENVEDDNLLSSYTNETNEESIKKQVTELVVAKKEEPAPLTPSKFHCCFCDKGFASLYRLKKHWAISHKDYGKFQCRMCTDEFVNVNDYVNHFKNEHFIKQYRPRYLHSITAKGKRKLGKCSCSVCKGGIVKDGCFKHMYDSDTNCYMCWNCGETFQSLLEYKQHGEKHGLIGKFTCEFCQKRHHNIFRLIGHLKNHFIPQNKCEICGVIFIKQESLAKHIKRHIEEPAHMCDICGKSFAVEARLQSHMRIHTGEKRFTCELCGKMYANKNNLLDHKRWHAGEKPFMCDICGIRTRSSGDMSKHKRKHLNKRSYVCEVCGRGFNFSHALAKHRLGHTGKRSFACKDCGRTYIYREGLMDHIKAQRCPVGRESGFKRTPKPKKLLKSGISANLMDVVESEVYVPAHTQRADTVMKDTQDWLCVLSNNETEVATSVLVVSSMY